MLYFGYFFLFVPKGPGENKTVIVEVMAWRRTGDKPIIKPMLTEFTEKNMLQGNRVVSPQPWGIWIYMYDPLR